MEAKCPVCDSQLTKYNERPNGRDAVSFSCPRCGDFLLSRTLINSLPSILERNKDASAKISHALRTMQQVNKVAELNRNTIDEILKRPLPSPREQADLLVRWLAENVEGPGEQMWVLPETHGGIIGAKSSNGFSLVLHHLRDEGLIQGTLVVKTGSEAGKVTLSFEGWEHYEQLRLGEITYHKAFMAMKFGDQDLTQVIEDVFKPCVQQAGFELFCLTDNQPAGLIDDQLRVAIQTSDFLIADLTHDNLGAYWEAGYAEGLGKPVIYTCEKEKFEKDKTHFDTNHFLTICWDKSSPENAGKKLKATIRATLPQLAKQVDV